MIVRNFISCWAFFHWFLHLYSFFSLSPHSGEWMRTFTLQGTYAFLYANVTPTHINTLYFRLVIFFHLSSCTFFFNFSLKRRLIYDFMLVYVSIIFLLLPSPLPSIYASCFSAFLLCDSHHHPEKHAVNQNAFHYSSYTSFAHFVC